MGYDRDSLIVGLAYGFVLCLGIGLVITGIIEVIPPVWMAGVVMILGGGGCLGATFKHSTNRTVTAPSITTPDQEEG